MRLSGKEILELHELLDALVENNLAGERLRRLEDWLVESEAARRHYVRFMDMSAGLRHYAEERLSDEDSDDVVPFDDDESKLIRFVRPALAVAAILVFGFLLLNSPLDFLFEENEGDLASSGKSGISVSEKQLADSSLPSLDGQTVGVLTDAVHVEWADDSELRPDFHEPIRAGKLKLNSGMVSIDFLQGANIVLEGPVEFDLSNSNEGVLHLGKLWAEVPQVAAGFTINTPGGKVVDLGTEFGLNVRENGVTEILVKVGKVLFEGKDRDAELAFEEIEAGEAVFINEKGDLTWIDMPTEPFFGSADLAYQSMEEAQRRHSAWITLSEELADEPSNALYFTFDDHRPSSRVLRNDARGKNKRHDGAIVGCKWIEGRWTGKGALAFDGEFDRVHLKLPTHFRSATLTAWVHIEELVAGMGNPIICAQPKTVGATCWGIDGSGRLALLVKGPDSLVSYVSSVAFRRERLGRWAHLATTYDAKKEMVSHYVDGRPFSREKMKADLRLFFDKSELGHASDGGTGKHASGLHGIIDEFAIFHTAFEEEEIRRLYEIGRPYALPPRLIPSFP